VILFIITTVAGPFKQSVTSQSHSASLEPTPEPAESQSSSGQTRRTTSEPIRKPSPQQVLHLASGAKLKVFSDGDLDAIRIKKPKSGIETFQSLLKVKCQNMQALLFKVEFLVFNVCKNIMHAVIVQCNVW